MDSGLLPVEHISSETRSRSTEVDRQTSRRQARAPVQVQTHAKKQRQAQAQRQPHTSCSSSCSSALVVAGSTAAAKAAVVAELLGPGLPMVDVPGETYLVLRHGARPVARAFLPGGTRPHPYQDNQLPARPPRRVELSLPAPPLASFALVQSPASGAFEPAYNRILLDAAARGGGLLFALDAAVLPGEEELDFLVGAAQTPVAVFFAFWSTDASLGCDLRTRMAAYRDVVASRVPRFEQAPWFLVAPEATPDIGAAELREALLDWSASAGRSSGPSVPGSPSVPAGPGVRRRVATSVDGRESGWEELLDRVMTTARQSVRHALTAELDELQDRCAYGVDSDGGPARMPAALDREMHALSLHCTGEVDAAIGGAIRRVLAHVLAEAPRDDVFARVSGALRRGIEEDGPDLARVLLVTSTSGAVAAVSGAAAAGALRAYQSRAEASGEVWPGLLPPLGIGLSGSCYVKWRDPEAEAAAARAWLEEAVRGTESALLRTVDERFEVVRQVLAGLVAEAVDHGLLLV